MIIWTTLINCGSMMWVRVPSISAQNTGTVSDSIAPFPDDTPLCKCLFAKQITYITLYTLPIPVKRPWLVSSPIYLIRKQKVFDRQIETMALIRYIRYRVFNKEPFLTPSRLSVNSNRIDMTIILVIFLIWKFLNQVDIWILIIKRWMQYDFAVKSYHFYNDRVFENQSENDFELCKRTRHWTTAATARD